MGTAIYITLFIVSFAISLIGAYNKGNKDGKKEMLDVLSDRKIITSDMYVKLLKIFNQ
jgi:hypothetical protein